MRKRFLIGLAVITALGVLGCNENTITGTVGERTLTGTIVTVGDLNGTDPAGIVIRVLGAGVETTVSPGGGFVMTGLPEGDLDLGFYRAEDGINATLLIESGVFQVTIDLEKERASTRRRATRAPRLQLQGTIVAISPDSITVLDSSRKMDVVAAITEDTVIRKGYRQLTTDDLAEGDHVHVRARPEEDGSLTAEEIKLQEGEDEEPRPSRMQLEGLILAVSPDSITVMDASSGEQTAAITSETRIRKGKDTLTVEDLAVGDRVHVKARVEDDDSLTAEEIKLQKKA